MDPQHPLSHVSLAYGSSGYPKPSHKFSSLPLSNNTTTDTFINTKNGGADPIMALALRPENNNDSVTARQAEVFKALMDFNANF